MRTDDDHSPISAQNAKRLFADWKAAPAIVLAVSGGPDSIALMWLAARWRSTLARGPRLIAVTVDHGLRAEAAAEAREVKRLARTLDLPHRTMRWTGEKPKTGLPAAARTARYRLLAQAGIGGLAAMARESERDGVLLARPFLHVAKSQLVATLKKAKIGFADDPTNRDTNFTRPRLREIMPVLAAEGGDARSLARLASRLARANQAVEVLVDGAERYLALRDREAPRAGFEANAFDASAFDASTFEARTFDASAFAAMPEEIRLRLLKRAIDRFGHEGPAELGKVEALLAALDQAGAKKGKERRPRLKQTLAGALVSLTDGRIRVEPAPRRRGRAD